MLAYDISMETGFSTFPKKYASTHSLVKPDGIRSEGWSRATATLGGFTTAAAAAAAAGESRAHRTSGRTPAIKSPTRASRPAVTVRIGRRSLRVVGTRRFVRFTLVSNPFAIIVISLLELRCR